METERVRCRQRATHERISRPEPGSTVFSPWGLVRVSIHCRLKSVSVREATLRRVTGKLLRLLDEAQAEVCIALVGDTRMRRLNRTYRNNDRTTDVLAFAYREVKSDVAPPLGDVVIAVPAARRQAKAGRHSLDEEVLRLLIHGVLHLVGYDHERSRRQARRMQRKETELFETLTPLPALVMEA